MQCLPFAPVLREGWAALLQEGLLGPLWRVLPRMLRAHHQGAGHGKYAPQPYLVGVCVCVHTLLPAPDLSPIISLVLLFTGFLIPQPALPPSWFGAVLLRRGKGEKLQGLKEPLSWVQRCVHAPPTHTNTCFQVAGELKYHPECFICLTCGTFIGDGDTYTLVEHSKLYW